ncbi:MAG: ABC transporter permease [Acidimicrobiales bacterium]
MKSGDDFREEQSGGAAQLASTVGTALQVFAYVALFVGIFIIYNTFTVSVAQRLREFALLRGRRRRQAGAARCSSSRSCSACSPARSGSSPASCWCCCSRRSLRT